ncbi:MAG: pyruvate kinase [Bdellovibrionales bacterium]|nr:pyruvate kinase [Bdellovibrionales bacterium]
MRRAKIVCTLGPATSSLERIQDLMRRGMDVARLNCSHGSHADLKKLVENVRQASRDQHRPVAILLDLQGPKIRIGKFPDGPVEVRTGDKVTITTRETEPCSATRLSTTYQELPRDVRSGDRILLDDGNVELRVLGVTGGEVETEVVFGGRLSNHKGMNLPGVKTSIPSLTEKDRKDLIFGLEHDVDYVALSFVREPSDVRDVQQLIHTHLKNTPVIAKIEKPEAVRNIDDIIAVADGVMIARGDMAVEISPQMVPSVQKKIVHKCNVAGVPVIIATQMLESMIEHARPTRAEASDVANAVFDGADAVMLSGETAGGKHPIQTVQIMTDIVKQAERDRETLNVRKPEQPPIISVADAIEHSAAEVAMHSGARAVVCITNSGQAAIALSKFRPKVPVFAITHRPEVLQRLALIWGVKGVLVPDLDPEQDILAMTEKSVASWWNTYLVPAIRPLRKGDILVITYGFPSMARAKTNSIVVHVVKENHAIPGAKR